MLDKLVRFVNFLKTEVAGRRNIINSDPSELHNIVNATFKFGLFASFVPSKFGGLGLTASECLCFSRDIARYSGALALLYTQHKGLQKRILNYTDETFKEKWLPPSCNGSITFSIALAHLRNIEKPLITAVEEKDDFILNGMTHYVTGYGLFNHVAVGFIMDGYEYIGLIPFNSDYPGLYIGEASDLIAAKSTNTVALKLNNCKIPKINIVCKNELGNFRNSGAKNVTISANNLGTMLAILDLISASSLMKDSTLSATYYKLEEQVLKLEDDLMKYADNEELIPARVKFLYLQSQLFFLADLVFRTPIRVKRIGNQLNLHHSYLI